MNKVVKKFFKGYDAGTTVYGNDYYALKWRDERPVWDREKCLQCGICYLSCPDAAIRALDEGYFEADLDICKGCGICARQCWNGTITMVAEEK